MMSRLARVFLYVIYVLIIGGLATAIALSFHTKKVAAPSPIPNTSKQVVTQSKPPTSAISKTPSRPVAVNKPATSKSTPAANPSPALANSGPGNTIGLFVAVSTLGAFAYRRRLLGILDK